MTNEVQLVLDTKNETILSHYDIDLKTLFFEPGIFHSEYKCNDIEIISKFIVQSLKHSEGKLDDEQLINMKVAYETIENI